MLRWSAAGVGAAIALVMALRKGMRIPGIVEAVLLAGRIAAPILLLFELTSDFRLEQGPLVTPEFLLFASPEGTAWFGVSAVPTVIFNEKVSLVGAVPEEHYRSLLNWILAGEPGGLLPLEKTNTSQSGAFRPGSV